MKKKLIAALLTTAMLFTGLTGCGGFIGGRSTDRQDRQRGHGGNRGKRRRGNRGGSGAGG